LSGSTVSEPRVRAPVVDTVVVAGTAALESGTPERPRGRAGPRDAGAVDAVEDAGESEPEPVEPADPVVSAETNAIGETAEPTPRATAKAPTRPTWIANPDAARSVADTDRRRYSIVRTRPLDVRR
jgi:hypothetical protein